MDKYIGKLLDERYEVLEIIGIGGMAVVYRARCRILNRFVAIKILKDEYAQNAEFRRRFYIESQAVAKLSHNNIVSVYDVSHTQGLDYIVMELIEGVTLKVYLEEHGGRISWQETLSIAQQIARALSHAHSRGIIHQDIKSQNVIILQDGTAKVTDFGIASFAGNQETKVIQEAIGSVHYISPEQAKGSRIDYRTDLYSLGVVMYEMLTGNLPFVGETPLAIVMQHLNAVPLLPSEIAREIPPGMDQIVMHAMCPNVLQRYTTADELLADFMRLKNNPNTIFPYNGVQVRDETQTLSMTQAMPSYQDIRRQEQMKQTTQPSTQPRAPQKKKKGFFERMSQSPTMLAGFAVACFVVIASVVTGILIFSGGSSAKTYEVPSFIGQDIEDALTGDYQQVFNLKRGEDVVSDKYAEGTVVAQSVEEGETVTSGATITLDVSVGAGEAAAVTIADYTDALQSTTENDLKRQNILYSVVEEASEKVEQGHVIRTEPQAGGSLQQNDLLIVYVSSGTPSVETAVMPNVVGKTLKEAEQMLKAYNIGIKKTKMVESTEPENTVVSQDIEGGTEVEAGDKVMLEISSGIAPEVTAPDNTDTTGDGTDTSGTDTDTETVGEATITVAIPEEAQSGSAHIVIILDDGNTAYDQVLQAPGTMVNVTVQGSGSRLATVYINDAKVSETPITFN